MTEPEVRRADSCPKAEMIAGQPQSFRTGEGEVGMPKDDRRPPEPGSGQSERRADPKTQKSEPYQEPNSRPAAVRPLPLPIPGRPEPAPKDFAAIDFAGPVPSLTPASGSAMPKAILGALIQMPSAAALSVGELSLKLSLEIAEAKGDLSTASAVVPARAEEKSPALRIAAATQAFAVPERGRTGRETPPADIEAKPAKNLEVSVSRSEAAAPGESQVQSNFSVVADAPSDQPSDLAPDAGIPSWVPGEAKIVGQAADRPAPPPGQLGLPPGLGHHLAETVARFPDRPVEVTLSPEELGRVRMTFNTTDGVLSLSLVADRPETLDLMRRHIDQLAEDFRDLGFDSISFSFAQSQDRDQAPFWHHDAPSDTDEPPGVTPGTAPKPTLRAQDTGVAGGLDIRI